MAALLYDDECMQNWLGGGESQNQGFFPEGMSPFTAFRGEGAGQRATGAPPRMWLNPLSSTGPTSLLGPQGPVPTMEDSDVAMSLIDILQSGSVESTPTPTPVGSPSWGHKTTPCALLVHGEWQNEPLELGAAHCGAAPPPPEFYLDAPTLSEASAAKTDRPAESHKRSRSLQTENARFVGALGFSLPVRVQPHIECEFTEEAVQALGLLDKELARMMQVIVV